MYYTYMIRCEDNSIYTGITTDVQRRWKEHKDKSERCAKYTMRHSVKKLESLWSTETRILASKLEYQIKTLKKSEKEHLIKTQNLSLFFEQKLSCEEYKVEKIKNLI